MKNIFKNKSNILVGILLVISSILFYQWYFNTPESDSKEKIEKLETENQKLSDLINSRNDKIDDLAKEIDGLEITINERSQVIDSLSNKIGALNEDIINKRKELDKVRLERDRKQKELEEFEENYKPKSKDELFKSLKNKFNKQ